MTYQSNILIVDDEAIGRETLQDLLVTEGYRLDFASDGATALAKAAELQPDLVLLDVMMPGMDGFEVCRRLRADPLLSEVPVIMVTALDDQASLLEGIQAGADDFISKPFNRAELRARTRTITRLNRYRRLLVERARFGWMVEQVDDGYLVIDAHDRILYANPQARLYLGLHLSNADQAASRPVSFTELAQRQYNLEPQRAWATWPPPSSDASPPTRYMVRPESPTSSAFWLQVDTLEMSAEAQQQYFIRLRDVTSSIETRNNMWTFHSHISHKLKTPLGYLTGFLEVLVEDWPKLSEKKIKTYLSAAQDGATRLKEEIMDVFQYVAVSDTVQPSSHACSVDTLSTLVPEVNADLEIQSITITYTDLPNPEVTLVPLSCSALKLVLYELLENALKFHPEQAPAVGIKVAGIDQGVSIQVRDDGTTLSPAQLAHAWTPYYQGEKYVTGQTPGMGLGLSVVAALVWNVGGTCRLYNRQEGTGVVVELVLPLAPPPTG
jgi:two-component system, cell cycle response regulator